MDAEATVDLGAGAIPDPAAGRARADADEPDLANGSTRQRVASEDW